MPKFKNPNAKLASFLFISVTILHSFADWIPVLKQKFRLTQAQANAIASSVYISSMLALIINPLLQSFVSSKDLKITYFDSSKDVETQHFGSSKDDETTMNGSSKSPPKRSVKQNILSTCQV